MDDQKKKQIKIAGALGAVLIGVLVYQLFFTGTPPPGAAPSSNGETAAAGADAGGAAGPKKPVKPKKDDVNLLQATEIDIEELTQSVEVQPIDYVAVKIARNPMAPLVGNIVVQNEGEPDGPGTFDNPPPPPPKKEVTGIIWDDVSPVAIIDNMVVHEGFMFADGIVVQTIEPTRVLLKNGESIVPLEMKEF